MKDRMVRGKPSLKSEWEGRAEGWGQSNNGKMRMLLNTRIQASPHFGNMMTEQWSITNVSNDGKR